MAFYITVKKSWPRWAASVAAGAAAAALACLFLSGPRLGRLYDWLLHKRPAPPPVQEILLLDMGERSSPETPERLLDAQAAFQTLLALTEFGAESLVVETPVLCISTGVLPAEGIRRLFDDEFGLLARNIRGLFTAIRTGSVSPGDSARYVEDMVKLAEAGKERLSGALIHQDGEAVLRLKKAALVFGNLHFSGESLIQADDLAAEAAQAQGYFRARPDRDGVLRRAAPVMESASGRREHLVFEALKGRPGLDAKGDGLPLDRNGALLLYPLAEGEDFRRLNFDEILEYDTCDRNFRSLLGEAGRLGVFDRIEPDTSPVFLYDFAAALREEMLENQDGESRARWTEARAAYLNALDAFLSGPAEGDLLEGYDDIVKSDALDDDGVEKVKAMMEETARQFAKLREESAAFLALRERLSSALAGSFCIMGQRCQDVEASALLANNILGVHSTRLIGSRDVFFLSVICTVFTALCLLRLGAWPALAVGAALTLLFGAAAGAVFIYREIWLDPWAVMSGPAAAALVSFCFPVRTKTAGRKRSGSKTGRR